MRIFILSAGLLLSPILLAVTEEFQFDENVSEQRYSSYIVKIRCLVCQNESLGSSRSELAVDLRRQIYNLMSDGKTNQQISTYLIERYGDFILYQPPLKKSTLLLWLGPFFLVGCLLFGLLRRIHKMPQDTAAKLTTEQKIRARSILENSGEK